MAAASAEHWFGRLRGVLFLLVEMERGVELLDSDRVEEAEEWEERGEFAMMSRSTLYVRLPVPVRQEDIGNVGEGIGNSKF